MTETALIEDGYGSQARGNGHMPLSVMVLEDGCQPA